MEFHISRAIRERLSLDDLLFSYSGNVVFANVAGSRRLAQRLNELEFAQRDPAKGVNGAALFAMGLIDELSHALALRYREDVDPQVLTEALRWFEDQVGFEAVDKLLMQFTTEFPNVAIFRGDITPEEWLAGRTEAISNREAAFEELMLLWLSNSNPAFSPFKILFLDEKLSNETSYSQVTSALPAYFATRPPVAPGLGSLLDALRAPMLAAPDSLTAQLDFIRDKWAPYLGEDLKRVLLAIDVLREEDIAIWMRFHPAGPDWHRHGQPGQGSEGFEGDEYVGFESEYVTGPDGVRRRRYATDYQAPLNEYEAFSADQAWMPTVVLIAKNTYVWLEQLSKKYKQHIHRLDQIPDEELRLLARRGISGLWLIGLWERSRASRTIKRLCGNSDAVASAYSLLDYSIAEDLGGESAYINLRDRAARAGLRLASDMVPNHMGIDSTWVIEHPEWFVSRWETPFPVYSFDGPDLSTDARVEIKIEDHYYDQSDAAVAFRIRHHREGTTRYMYHGNDGTTFAWNDTAQLDYSKADVREHVIQVILDVARRFPIIRFDAAMVLAKRHVQRLWFPLPGAGGSIPSRAEDAMSQEAFDALMPKEFWREVVDRVAAEVPGTLLLAEAFWLLEGYFVRTLGMHRVYNSAFMNMLRDEENAKYRSYLKKTVEFDPDILKRYVNFMSNPDERTAVDQFGDGDKYFGVSLLLATLPGLPMFGHGQVEGYTERYGMDFKQARLDEQPNEALVARHMQLIAPLLKKRHLFAESTNFVLYDFWNANGGVDENVFAYSNRAGDERALILFNNRYESTHGTIHSSVGFLDKGTGSLQQTSLADGLSLPGEDWVVFAFRDAVGGLEYLRRASDLRASGLTLGLRGYQHVALLDWRELVPTAAMPWDRLCDALYGAGVYSVEDALRQLRIRPLLEALRQTVNEDAVREFASLASVSRNASSVTQSSAGEKDGLATEPAQPVDLLPVERFVAKAEAFAIKVEEVLRAEGALLPEENDASPEVSSSLEKDHWPSVVLAARELPSHTSLLPKTLQQAASIVLPGAEESVHPARQWAPVLAWVALQALSPRLRGLQAFDAVNLRLVLAETFSSVGLVGEGAWRAAAQVRLLAAHPDPQVLLATLRTPDFWRDGDVCWLAGVNGEKDRKYVNQEAFEQLLCWMCLPAFLNVEEKGSVLQAIEVAVELRELAAQAGYEYDALLKMLAPADLKPEPPLPLAEAAEPMGTVTEQEEAELAPEKVER